MKNMIDFDKGWDGMKDQANSLIRSLTGDMTHFPLCCSTGVLKSVTAGKVDNNQKLVFDGTSEYTYGLPDRKALQTAQTIHELIRATKKNPYFVYPWEVGVWYCMSLILRKIDSGKDDGGTVGYTNYKAAQIAMFDRLLEDKDPDLGFRFQYNMVFSVDHFQQWLSEQKGVYGEVYLSPAVPGGHKARVRGCIFTPNLDAMKAYEAERIELLRGHLLANYDFLKSRTSLKTIVKDATARLW